MKLTRRDFIKAAGAAGVAAALGGCASAPESGPRREVAAPTGDQAYMAVVRGSDPAAITTAAVSSGATYATTLNAPAW